MNALVLIDIQNDFLPGGALAVPGGNRIIPVVNRLQPLFKVVVATQDWHPPDHGSFAENHPEKDPGEMMELAGLPQILWPVHCVKGTDGAAFSEELDQTLWEGVFTKGVHPQIDSYSGFFDNGQRQETGLTGFLHERDVTDLYLAGLATDYCVKWTAQDAVRLGFRTHIVLDAYRGVDLNPGDVDRAVETMREAGVSVITAAEVVQELAV